MHNLLFSLNIVAPVFLIVFLGVFLRYKNIINEQFNSLSSQVVFKVALPALAFSKIASTDLQHVFNARLILVMYTCLILFVIISWITGYIVTKNPQNRGVFIQASFRSNFAIIGFALIFNAYGETALANAAIMLAFIMPFYNIISIVALTVPLHHGKELHSLKIVWDVVKNPLIIGCFTGVAFSLLNISVHPIFDKSITYLANMALPLALLSIGGSLCLNTIKQDFSITLGAVLMKLVVMPLVLTSLVVALGFRGKELTMLFFLFSAPAAIASYIMAEALGSNGKLAANVVLLTTLFSTITISIGLTVLKTLGLI